MSQKKWVRRTLRQLSQALQQLGNQVGRTTVGRLADATRLLAQNQSKEVNWYTPPKPKPSVQIHWKGQEAVHEGWIPRD